MKRTVYVNAYTPNVPETSHHWAPYRGFEIVCTGCLWSDIAYADPDERIPMFIDLDYPIRVARVHARDCQMLTPCTR